MILDVKFSKLCTLGTLVLLYILLATKLKMNPEFGAEKPKRFSNTSKHPHLCEDSNEDLQFINWCTFLFLN